MGETVAIPDGIEDMDGDIVPFSTGKVVEIDLSASPPRVWLESADGKEDVRHICEKVSVGVDPLTKTDILPIFRRDIRVDKTQ